MIFHADLFTLNYLWANIQNKLSGLVSTPYYGGFQNDEGLCLSTLFTLSTEGNMENKSFYFPSIVIVSYCRRFLRPNCLIGDYRFIGQTREMESSAVILPIQGAHYVTQFVSTRTNLLSSPPPKSTPCTYMCRN